MNVFNLISCLTSISHISWSYVNTLGSGWYAQFIAVLFYHYRTGLNLDMLAASEIRFNWISFTHGSTRNLMAFEGDICNFNVQHTKLILPVNIIMNFCNVGVTLHRQCLWVKPVSLCSFWVKCICTKFKVLQRIKYLQTFYSNSIECK